MAEALGAQTTTDALLAGRDLSGMRVLVTGASAGLGVETVRAFAAHGAEVVGMVRDRAKAEAALSSVHGSGRLDLVVGDLASLASVRSLADALNADGRPFDRIIANAGVMACEGRTIDGFDMQFGTNHLGHFVLVNRIASLLRDGGRLVNLTSAGHRFSDVDLDDPNFERRPYHPWRAYGQSKTANIQFALAFDRRHRGRGVRAAAVHPGMIPTELSRHQTAESRAALGDMSIMAKTAKSGGFLMKTPEQGAATTIWAAIVADPEAVGGRYCEDCHVADIDDRDDASTGVRSYAVDSDRAEALWTKSEEMVGERFG